MVYKNIILNDTCLLYEIIEECSDNGSRWKETHFYSSLETETKTYHKYWLFGEKITEEHPLFMFKLGVDIETIKYTKSQMREMISRELELHTRGEEIKLGEIV